MADRAGRVPGLPAFEKTPSSPNEWGYDRFHPLHRKQRPHSCKPIARDMTGRQRLRVQEDNPAAVTIYDIAERAGVHPSTVSRALNRPGRVSAITRQKIEAAAAELRYRLNSSARALSTGHIGAIGLIVKDLSSPSQFRVIRGVERAAASLNYALLLAESGHSSKKWLAPGQWKTAAADGLILADSCLADDQIQQLAKQKPLVVLNRAVQGVHSLVAEQRTGIGEAVRHLRHAGHKRITYLRESTESWLSAQRWEDIVDRCSWSRMEADRITAPTSTVEGGRASAREVLDSGSTAVICFNDLMAIGLMQEVISTGVCVPDKMSILGFDNHFGSDFAYPPLTTISSPLEAIGDAAFRLIVAQLGDGTMPGARQELKTGLIIRGSSGSLIH